MNVVTESPGQAIDFISAAAGLGGVLVGGLISYLTTRKFELSRQTSEKKGLAYRVFFDVARMVDDIQKIATQSLECTDPEPASLRAVGPRLRLKPDRLPITMP